MYVMSVIFPTILNVYLTFLCVSCQVFFTYLFVYTVPSSTPSFIALEELHTWLASIEHWVQVTARVSLRLPTKSIVSAVCPFHPRPCLDLDSSPSPQGKRTFNSTLNHPPSRFLQRPAILPFGPGTFTHNIASVPIHRRVPLGGSN